MKKDEIQKTVRISVYMSVIVAFLYLLVSGTPVDVSTAFRALTTGVTLTTFFWTAYFKWLWKWPWINKVLYRPNMNGTWGGWLHSDWRDEYGREVAPKEFFIVIRQNFLQMSLTTFTNNFIGISYSENLILDEEKGVRRLIYLYKKDTSDFGSQKRNEGACELRVIEADPVRMEGVYWSNIKTNGTIKVHKISDAYIDSFDDGLSAEQ